MMSNLENNDTSRRYDLLNTNRSEYIVYGLC